MNHESKVRVGGLRKLLRWIFGISDKKAVPIAQTPYAGIRVLKRGQAARVVFFMGYEDLAYVENPNVTLFENGVVHIKTELEETTTHLQNCEVIWKIIEREDRQSKPGQNIRLIRPSAERPSEPGPA